MNRSTILMLGGCVMGGALAVVALRPAYHHHREQHWLRLADQFLQTGDYRAAELSAQRALALNPASVRACRVQVQLADLTHSPRLLSWQERLAQLAPTVSNRLALATTSLRVESPPFPTAEKTLKALAYSAQNDSGFHRVAAERAVLLRRWPEAEDEFKAALQLEPSNRLDQLNLAVVRLQSPDRQKVAQACRVLRELARLPDLKVPALRSLTAEAAGRQNWTEALELSDELLSLTNSMFSDQLQRLGLLAEAKQPGFTNYLAKLEESGRDRTDDAARLATWLNTRGLAIETRRWLKTQPRDHLEGPPLAVVYGDAAMIQRDWAWLLTNLPRQKWGAEEFVRLAILARAAQEQGDNPLGQSYWGQAARLADKEAVLADLVRMAESWGWADRAEQLLWQAAKKYPEQRWPLEMLERAYYLAGDTPGLYKAYSAALARRPEDPFAKNDLAAVSLLLRTNLSRAHVLAREAYAAQPSSPLTVSTYAFSLYVQGKPTEGLRVLQTLQTNELEQPSLAAYYAVLLGAAGQPDQAADYRKLAQRGRLLPEERVLLEKN